MRKRVVKWICLIGLILPMFGTSMTVLAEEEPTMMDLIQAAGYTVDEMHRPKSIVLIDANTGKYLWGENPDLAHNPASIMKLMTLYLVYEAMEQGKFSLDTTIVGNDRYQQISQIYALSNAPIITGVEYPVRELIPMLLVPSSNVATLMLAELVEPNPVIFLEMMNAKAAELGMNHTKIYNATGAAIFAFDGLYLPEGIDGSTLQTQADNETTARDLAILVYHLLKLNPDVVQYTNQAQATTMQGTPYEETFDSYNHSLPGLKHAYEGVDGLKTGSSQSGGFNIAMTGQRGEMRLITIVLGVGDWVDQNGEYYRQPFANAAFEYGFTQFAYREILSPGEHTVQDEKIILEESLFDTIRNEQDLSMIVEGDQIHLANGLSTISDNIPQVTQTVTKVKTPEVVVQEVTEKVGSVLNLDFFGSKLGLGIALGIGILVLLIILIVVSSIQNKRRRRIARQNRGRR